MFLFFELEERDKLYKEIQNLIPIKFRFPLLLLLLLLLLQPILLPHEVRLKNLNSIVVAGST